MDCNRLFVYGTLMRCAEGRLGEVERRRLANEARCLGAAYLNGYLYDLGDYPGLVIPDEATEAVHGEVFELDAPGTTLRWLDDYEGVRQGGGANDEYICLQTEVWLTGGGSCNAWVYVYRHGVGQAGRILGGRWNCR